MDTVYIQYMLEKCIQSFSTEGRLRFLTRIFRLRFCIEKIHAFGCGMEGTEEAVLTFVLHGGFTDALFRKWLAICRSRSSDLDSHYVISRLASCIQCASVFSIS